ncbi:PREDICTED: MARVEL domain-containing protein 3 [Chrysochloris asiatica]|uniref:MARVEL domain-containing protein 3 n=1 Tax=Chrysochloris asiatica TaxID=185453 RepID=A0A9B0WMI1_CHRAS|nr:PREDICTED: MARVEL domain-containing protein 3 [Chrysochloris asiatica]
MEEPSRAREPRARPRERDPDRHLRPNRDHQAERQRDKPRDRRREREWDVRRNADQPGDRDRGRDPRQDRHRAGSHRPDEQRVWGKSSQSQTRAGPPGSSWEAAPPPWPSPWKTPEPEPWPMKKQDFERRAPDSERASGRYVPSHPRHGGEEVEYYQSEAEGLLECHKCRYLCTGRGVVQILEVILNGMVLICIVASYFVLAGFSASITSGGGFGNNYYSPFEGTELEQVRQLDQKYTILRSPLIYSGVAVSLGLGVLTMGVLLQGAKSLTKLPGKWLLMEAAFSLLAAVGYCIGIGIYLHVALRINSTDTCKTRERLYARRGLTWMNCQLAGTDGAAATFACLLVILYGASIVLALRSYREQKHYKDSRYQLRNDSGPPQYLWSETL